MTDVETNTCMLIIICFMVVPADSDIASTYLIMLPHLNMSIVLQLIYLTLLFEEDTISATRSIRGASQLWLNLLYMTKYISNPFLKNNNHNMKLHAKNLLFLRRKINKKYQNTGIFL